MVHPTDRAICMLGYQAKEGGRGRGLPSAFHHLWYHENPRAFSTRGTEGDSALLRAYAAYVRNGSRAVDSLIK